MIKKLIELNRNFLIKKFDFNKMLCEQLWIAGNQNQKDRIKLLKGIALFFKYLFKTILDSFLRSPIIKFQNPSKDSILFIRKYSRPSIDNHTKYYENIDGTTVCVLTKKKIKIDPLTFFYCIFFIVKFRKYWLESYNFYGVKFFSLEGLRIFIYFFDSLSDSIKVLPTLLKHSKLVSFQDHVMSENILCQIANMNEIETFSLQHALAAYSNKSTFIDRYSTQVTYVPTVCKNILVWGEYNKNIFRKFTDKKIFIIGKPDLPNEKPTLDGVTLIFQDKVYEEGNTELLKIYKNLTEHKVPVSRWFKPGHILIENSPVRDGPLRKIVVGTNSSLCFELGILGFQVFLLEQAHVSEALPHDLILRDASQIIKNYKSLENYPHNFWKFFIDCHSEECMSRYKAVTMKKM